MVTMLRKALQNFPPHKRKHIFLVLLNRAYTNSAAVDGLD